ncbi:disease resistance protein RPM1-like [Elaeis guineensis]|uniref:Disease resistance protein RPM1-like n=1 Tax=Elaeis guineensis var. tenera TaxID=51953 RepID=A0A6I9SNN7_ELAGV|nr:disease resistance protein RPM1-like [Elaeis guineensis]
MAEEIVTELAMTLIKKLISTLSSEMKMPELVRQDVQSVERELKRMKDFVRLADADAQARARVKEVNDLACDTEDLLDESRVYMAMPHRHGIKGFIDDIVEKIKKCREKHEIYNRLQEIKERIKQADERSSHFHVEPVEERGEPPDLKQLAALFVEEKDLVGIDKPREDLIKWLLEGSKSLRVISVVAMGGMGKTALVKNVYDNSEVRKPGQFDFHVWFTLQKTFDVEMLLRNMIQQLLDQEEEDPTTAIEVHHVSASLLGPYIPTETRATKKQREIEAANVDGLIQILRGHLQNKRYVIVLDELWSISAWESIKLAFPDNELGSRVVITTRNTQIAATASSLYCPQNEALVYNLQPLSEEDSRTLFCKKAFASETCPQDFKDVSEKFLKTCGGLPLAIVTIGGLLAITRPKTVEKWTKLHENLGHAIDAHPNLEVIKHILSLSYDDLPYHLKLCFLYLSIFPEDYPIRRGRLVRLWMGEGLFNAEPPMTVEDMADECFDELVTRSMIQVTETDPSGKAKSCKVHDIMREIIISKSREEEFFYSILKPSSPRPTTEKVRRLTTHCDVRHPLNVSFAHLRSLILFSVFVSSSLKSAKLLRVLDVERQDIGSHFLPHGSRLQHLRYLNLRGTERARLPEALSMLQNLEMLDLRDSYIVELPAGIVKLQRLRYLAVYSPRRNGVSMPRGICGLKELCTLVLANAEAGFIEEVAQMERLRRLGVSQLTMQNEGHFWTAIQKLSRLQSLTAHSKEDNLMSSMGSSSQLPSLLRSLKLHGLVMEKLPGHIESLKNLAKMVLSGTKLKDDPFPVLEKLPSLSELRLHEDAYVGEELHSKGGFLKLRTMHLMRLSELKLVMVKGMAMPIVESLRIKWCGKGRAKEDGVNLQMEGDRDSLIDRQVQ